MFFIFACLALAAFGCAEGEWIEGSRVEVDASGPLAVVTISWKKLSENCFAVLPHTYEITVCRDGGGDDCSQHSALGKSSLTLPKTLPFWTSYSLTIDATCFSGIVEQISRRTFTTGPGELLPLASLDVVPDDGSVTVRWTEQTAVSQPASEVALAVYKWTRFEENATCFRSYSVDKDKLSYQLGDLTPGVKYQVRARLVTTHEHRTYESRPLNRTFQCGSPDADDFPPPVINSVTVNRTDNVASLHIELQKPALPGPASEWMCFLVSVRCRRGRPVTLTGGQRLADDLRSVNGSLVVVGVPEFTTVTVSARSAYRALDDIVRSPASTRNVTIVGSPLSTPKILLASPVSMSAAIVHWSHPTAEGSDVQFHVRYGTDDNMSEIYVPPAAKRYLVITNLTSASANVNRKVEVSASVAGGDRTKPASAKFRLLPAGALPPNITNYEVNGQSIALKWTAMLPWMPINCSFVASACAYEGRLLCHNLTSIEATAGRTDLPFFAFRENAVTLTARCEYLDIVATEQSETLKIFGVFAPTRVLHLTGQTMSSRSVHVWFTPNDFERPFISGYVLRWKPISADGAEHAWSGTVNIAKTWYKLEKLEEHTSYNVSVQAYVDYGNVTHMGVPAFVTVKTGLPTPPPVTDLEASVEPLSSIAKLTWNQVDYPSAPLKFFYAITCESGQFSGWAKATNASEPVRARANSVCRAAVRPVTDAGAAAEQASGPPREVEFCFPGLAAPLNVTLVSRHQHSVVLEVIPSPAAAAAAAAAANASASSKSGNETQLGYQLAVVTEQTLGEPPAPSAYDEPPQNTGRFVVRRLAPFTEYAVSARVCVGDFCGDDLVVTVTTAVGPPQPVQNLNVRANRTLLQIAWMPPEDARGPLDGYVVAVLSAAANFSHEVTLDSNQTSIVVEVNEEFARYTVRVAAFNVNPFTSERVIVSGFPQVASVRAGGSRPPPPAKLFETSTTSSSVSLSWIPDAVDDAPAHFYRITWAPAEVGCSPIDAAATSATQRARPALTASAPVTELYAGNSSTASIDSLEPYTEYSVCVAGCTAKEASSCGRPKQRPVSTLAGRR